MVGTMDILIRRMTIEDYKRVYEPWADTKSFGIRSIDDSREEVERFLKRSLTTSVVAAQNGLIIGGILCGHDGGIDCFYHVYVAPGHRKYGIGYCIVRTVIEALQREGVDKISLTTPKNNKVGNIFRQGIGWAEREDVNSYEFILNEGDITRFAR